jgi:hypothetical protein
MRSMISRVELTSPPGVFISINTASAWVRVACSIAREMYSALMGWIVSFTTTFTISADALQEQRQNNRARNAALRGIKDFIMSEPCQAVDAGP